MARSCLSFAAVLIVLAAAGSAAAAPIWVKPQRGEQIPAVDGKQVVTPTEFEYSPGHRFFLNNWQRDIEAAWNSEAFLQVQDPQAVAAPGMLFIAVKVPRRVHPDSGQDEGHLTIYLRPDIHDSWNCPSARDHKIELTYKQKTPSDPVARATFRVRTMSTTPRPWAHASAPGSGSFTPSTT